MVSVPRLWPGATVVCLGTGPSLTPEDVAYCRGRSRVVAVNDAVALAPWADALYACDLQWWKWHDGVPAFTGPKWSVVRDNWAPKWRARFADVQRLQITGDAGLETQPTGLRTGGNSGYQAINLAVHYGARRIVLLGYDMQRVGGRRHFFGDHPQAVSSSPYGQFRQAFASLVAPLIAAGVEVVNATPGSALTAFPCADLRAVLPEAAEVAA